MNCKTFEELITDLVREDLADETIRGQARAHAESCSRCAARLANERALTAGLKLAAADTGGAPAQIEAALISAYRRRQEEARGIPQSTIPRGISARYGAIAAALLLALLGIMTYRMLHRAPSDRAEVAGSQTKGPAAERPAQNREASTPARTQEKDVSNPVVDAGAGEKSAAPGHATPRTDPKPVEIATDFIALRSGTDISSMESGQLVRVLLPRSALASYGLPVNPERAEQPVTAQVLVGQDGVACAIRFLSNADSGFVQTGTSPKR